ncbi:sensor histidine kinase [Marinobacterium jannaschii]|uniref:sensor histidine kinase n=1 Tax=Marinobacterium jannaschii TaxID=64970 RepID=UPI0004816E76|nr:HAMP domain-containing sensor histidine kinase [Marinobacterium jannaschii]
MNYRTAVILATLILLPVMILGWMGVRLEYNQQQLGRLQLQALIDQRLQSIDGQLQQHFATAQQRLLQQATRLYRQKDRPGQGYSPEQLRHWLQREALVGDLFVLSPQQQRAYPVGELTRREQQFIARTERLLARPQLFQVSSDDPQVVQAPVAQQSYLLSAPLEERAQSQARVTLRAPAAEYTRDSAQDDPISGEQSREPLRDQPGESPAEQSGWLAWYADMGLQHIFWWQDPDGYTLGFALDASRLKSDLINRLPASQPDEASRYEIRLINSNAETLYAFGSYRESGDQALRSLPLSHPLGSWRLEYHAPDSTGGAINWFTLTATLLLLTAGLSALGWWLYREQRRELELAQQRVNFVNQVSHELKTPLTNVRMYAEMLEQRLDNGDSRTRRYLAVINNESRRLSRLIENVLSFSRKRHNGHQLSYRTGVIDDCVQQVIDTFSPVLAQRGLRVEFSAAAGAPVQFDPEALEQILNNLLSNCEKYAADSELIEISSGQQGSHTSIRVADRGPGIAESETRAVFEPFYRVSNALTDGVTGTGIGLGLARDIARAHGGDLTLERWKQGCCFLLTLETPQ